jgi:hypothetical protein
MLIPCILYNVLLNNLFLQKMCKLKMYFMRIIRERIIYISLVHKLPIYVLLELLRTKHVLNQKKILIRSIFFFSIKKQQPDIIAAVYHFNDINYMFLYKKKEFHIII